MNKPGPLSRPAPGDALAFRPRKQTDRKYRSNRGPRPSPSAARPQPPRSVKPAGTAWISTRFLLKFFETRTPRPFAIYCVVGGVVYFVFLLAIG
jgi:hypothetical protein